MLFWREVGGGLALGLVIGLMAYHMIKRIDQYQVEIPLTLAVASGGYALAEVLHVWRLDGGCRRAPGGQSARAPACQIPPGVISIRSGKWWTRF